MKTYFVAGKSVFSDRTTWEFWRVVNWTDEDSAQEFIQSLVKELDESNDNLRSIDSYFPLEKGNLIITAFNQL